MDAPPESTGDRQEALRHEQRQIRGALWGLAIVGIVAMGINLWAGQYTLLSSTAGGLGIVVMLLVRRQHQIRTALQNH
jgi:type IV secretory pathway VirB2 component (pilin)